MNQSLHLKRHIHDGTIIRNINTTSRSDPTNTLFTADTTTSPSTMRDRTDAALRRTTRLEYLPCAVGADEDGTAGTEVRALGFIVLAGEGSDVVGGVKGGGGGGGVVRFGGGEDGADGRGGEGAYEGEDGQVEFHDGDGVGELCCWELLWMGLECVVESGGGLERVLWKEIQ